ncbi:MAG: tRNA uridine-5-carboxymethylaminomethyl(34) synthesis GTPase MnmE [Elusimicrobia bacterium]|nr:tRNA uridine-5-carboxymethylaminomethyl(34) synthesis GTPase MnmE [Elusimicrobiota bacterium]
MLLKNTEDLIVSLSSGLEKSAVALIRFSGKDCVKTVNFFLNPKVEKSKIVPGQIKKVKIISEEGELIDNALGVFYISPKSYTGQDMLELFCHGSPYIIKKTLSLAHKYGARQALPGEFTFRAYINGKLNLSQAEAVNDLINSETEKQHKAAISQLKGDLSEKIKSYREKIISLLAELEVRIDDTYEEVSDLDKKSYLARLEELKQDISRSASSFEKGNLIKKGVNTVICGLPNCGKSSLLNRLAGYERAIVSPIAGTTRDVVEETAEIAGYKFSFSDTAGLNKNAKDEVEKEGIKRSEKAVKKADIVIFVRDLSQKESKEEKEAFEFVTALKSDTAKLIEAFSKSDLPKAREPKTGFPVFSSLTGEGIERLKDILADFCADGNFSYSSAVTSLRHYESLSEALCAVEKAYENAFKNGPMEITAENLRQSLSSIGEIAGETVPEDILAEIFSNFCVGK